MEACEDKEASIASGVEVYAVFCMTEGARQQQGEDDAKKCQRKYAPLFHPAPDWEWVQGRAIVLGSNFHAFMKRGTSNPLQ